jgi:hypothetical protein
MVAAAIHVVPDDNFDDWVVRDHDGHEFGHYPTREVAERAAEAITRERGTNSSFISLTEEPAARILRRGGRPDSSRDDQAEAGDALSHLDAVGELGCRLFEDRRRCPARTAPGSPEINQQRNVTVL